MAKKKYSTSSELMEAIRALDYKQQYKVCKKFYKILKSLHEDNRMMYQRFYESFELDMWRDGIMGYKLLEYTRRGMVCVIMKG